MARTKLNEADRKPAGADSEHANAVGLRIAVAQPATTTDIEKNVVEHVKAIEKADGSQLIVYPECSITGYDFSASITTDDPRLQPLVDACTRANIVALIGAIIPSHERKYIAQLRVDSEGVSVAHRKILLAEEEQDGGISPGQSWSMIKVADKRVGIAICRETKIICDDVDIIEQLEALELDVLVAGVLFEADETTAVRERGRTLNAAALPCAAIALASFAGPTGEGYDQTLGRSAIFAANGELLVEASERPGDVVVCTV